MPLGACLWLERTGFCNRNILIVFSKKKRRYYVLILTYLVPGIKSYSCTRYSIVKHVALKELVFLTGTKCSLKKTVSRTTNADVPGIRINTRYLVLEY